MPYQVMTPYVPVTDFSDDEAQQTGGRSTVDTSGLDAEFAALVTLTDQVRNNLGLMQRTDGFIQDKFIHPSSLSNELLTLMVADFNPTGDWLTATAYKIKDIVKETGITYMATEDHTSGVFLTDLAAGIWLDFGDLTAAEIKTAYESNADTNAFTDTLFTKLDAIEALADVTDTANVTAAGALMDSEVDLDIKTLVLPASTTISAFGRTLVDDAAAVNGRATLGVVIGTNVQAFATVLQNTTASFLIADETKLGGIEALADVTDTANVTAAGALMDSEVDADIKTLVLPASTTISAYGRTLIDDAAAVNARATLEVQPTAAPIFTGLATVGTLKLTGTLISMNPSSGNSSIEIGSQTGASTPFIDWHSSATGADFHFRMVASGGTTIGTGMMTFQGGTLALGNTNLTITGGTIDGRDVGVDGTKLDLIEDNADVTDAANVNAAGAIMESDFANNSVRFKNNAGTMGNIVLAASQILGRKSTGEIDNLTATETRTILGIEAGSTADQTDAEIQTAYENATSFALDGAVSINASLADVNFVIASDLNANMFFIDAFNNSVHIDNNLLTGAGDGDLVMANNKNIKWVDGAGSTSANSGIKVGPGNSMNFNVPAATNAYTFIMNTVSRLQLREENAGIGIHFITESSADHAAPAANRGVLYTKDVAGRTNLFWRDNTGVRSIDLT